MHPASVGGLQAQVHGGDLELVVQAQRQVGDGLQQREAVELEPQGFVERQRAGMQASRGLDALAGSLHEVGAQHLFQRPAGDQALCTLGGQVVQAPAHGLGLFADHLHKALAQCGGQAIVVQHLGGGLQVGQ